MRNTSPTSLFSDLSQDHGVLLAEYGRVQKRCSELIQRQAAEIARLQAEQMRLRARLIARESALAFAQQDSAELAAAMPGLGPRRQLAQRVEGLLQRVQDLLRERARAQFRTPAKAVLCIGREESRELAAQSVVEWVGGSFARFKRFDAQATRADEPGLDAYLQQADLVICQTGCLSHGDYWRVQDHCRRTGKPCILLDRSDAPLAAQTIRFYEQAAR
ncbi:hypothetical protein HNP55_000236 [Paucibacter oligotrophus]|uniref:DUF2325 domain-containing protein n=1 Tax=Roseateles oligotrophus TaxID=1769250 RepID=A0A840L1P2_9BURK|nr:DUF2325 domain-containing protein [Roseateles oligotrophus]MBB4841741.1 hypothetical protein [Roseateles oligotrophus]